MGWEDTIPWTKFFQIIDLNPKHSQPKDVSAMKSRLHNST